MSRKYMKTTTGTQAGTFRMYRDSNHTQGLVFIELQVEAGLGEGIRNENRRIDCGYMHIAEPAHYDRGYKTSDVWDQQLRLAIDYQELAPAASDSQMYSASTTVKAFYAFVRKFSDQILQALLDSEGEVFNPITNEKRVPYPLYSSKPLQETWIRISDDENALARIWDDEFKKLAGRIVPVKRWNNHDKTHRRPQNNIWAVIDREHTAALGMSTGVGLPPHLWGIIDIDREYTFSDEQMSFLEPEPAVEPEPVEEVKGFQVGKTYKNWPHGNATCKVISVLPLSQEVRVEIENSNGNIVRRWAAIKPRSHMNTDSIIVDVEPFYTPCFNACDVVEVDA